MKIWLTQHKAYFVYVYKFYFLVFNADNCFYKGQMEDCFAKKSENKVGKKKKSVQTPVIFRGLYLKIVILKCK